MRSNRYIACVSVALIALAAQPKTCKWIGPQNGSGLWSSTANWENGNKPTNGDSIVFSSGAAATNDVGDVEVAGLDFNSSAGTVFEVGGSAKLSLSGGCGFNVGGSNTSLTFKCPVELMEGAHTSAVASLRFSGLVTGKGDIQFGGGSLYFGKNMPNYFGNIYATNAVVYPLNEAEYGSGALGRSNVVHASRISILKNGMQTDQSCAVYMYNRDASKQTLMNYCGGVHFRGPTYFSAGVNFRITPHGAVFDGPVYFSQSMILTLEGTYSMTCNAPIGLINGASNAEVYCDQAGIVNFNSTGNTYTAANFYSRETVLSFNVSNAMARVDHAVTQGKGTIVVKGDQICKSICGNGGIVTSTVPATITMKGDYGRSFAGKWMGGLTLCWSPTWATSHTLSAAVEHTMSGKLISEKGTLNLTAGSSFPNLSGIEVASGATIKVPANVVFNADMERIDLGATATLDLATNENVTVARLFVDGNRMGGAPDGSVKYGGADCAVPCCRLSQIKGGGTITVLKPSGAVIYVF